MIDVYVHDGDESGQPPQMIQVILRSCAPADGEEDQVLATVASDRQSTTNLDVAVAMREAFQRIADLYSARIAEMGDAS